VIPDPSAKLPAQVADRSVCRRGVPIAVAPDTDIARQQCKARGRAAAVRAPGRPAGGLVVTDPPAREVLIEMVRVGNAVKVTAVDPETLVEVSIVGSPAQGEEVLRRNAINKLNYMLRKRGEGGSS
jgi:hypothetical protein